MSTNISEFFEEYESIPAILETDYAPIVETTEEYNYVEPSIDVPPPDDSDEQNPGFVNGAHT